MSNSAISPQDRTQTKILAYCRKKNLGKGHHLIIGDQVEISLQLDAQEKPLLTLVINGLIESGIFKLVRGESGPEFEISDKGENIIFGTANT